jgi:hypothetical protein
VTGAADTGRLSVAVWAAPSDLKPERGHASAAAREPGSWELSLTWSVARHIYGRYARCRSRRAAGRGQGSAGHGANGQPEGTRTR